MVLTMGPKKQNEYNRFNGLNPVTDHYDKNHLLDDTLNPHRLRH